MSQPAPTVQPVQEPVAPAEPVKTNEDYMAELNTVLAGKWNNAARDNANAILEQIKDPTLKEQAKQAIIAKRETAEERSAGEAAALKKANSEYSKLNSIEKANWLDAHPEWEVDMATGKLKKAKKK